MNDNDLRPEMSPEEYAAEDAAFASAFESAPETQDSIASGAPAAIEPATPVEPVEPATPAEPVTPAEPAAVVAAGLTEDQLTSALARVSQQQTTIDKLGGRLGQLMQQVDALKAQPRTGADQQSFDLKLERLTAAFPELAEVLREDLKGLAGGGAPAQAAAPAVPTFTAEDVNRIVTEKLTTFQQQQELGLEVRMLGTQHPDWQDVIRTPQFALWRDNVITDGKELMSSENAAFISLKLTQFKDWSAKAIEQAAGAAPAASTPNPRAQRLASAVLPGASAPPPAGGVVSEEDAFALAFNKERGRTGH